MSRTFDLMLYKHHYGGKLYFIWRHKKIMATWGLGVNINSTPIPWNASLLAYLWKHFLELVFEQDAINPCKFTQHETMREMLFPAIQTKQRKINTTRKEVNKEVIKEISSRKLSYCILIPRDYGKKSWTYCELE